MLTHTPNLLLFSQHGWADDNQAMTNLAQQVAPTDALIVAPSLGYIETWLRMEPLISVVERIAAQQIHNYPDVPIRVVGHSMGGLIWLEVLNRHPEWWPKIHSLVMVASPVGGADLGRMLDPLGLGIGIARDLGINRRAIAESIAAQIPTLTIAGDIGGGSDGTVPVACTKVPNAQFICLEGLSHAAMRNHARVAAVIRDFWEDFSIGEPCTFDEVIRRLHNTPGMTDGQWRDFDQSKILIQLQNGGTVRYWMNPLGIEHVFVASPEGDCLYAGFVGWLHAADLHSTLDDIRQNYAAVLN